MPNICFHALVPQAEVAALAQRFQQLSTTLIDAAAATDIRVTHSAVACAEEDQLRQIFRDEHADAELENASVYAFIIELVEPQRSLNETAMVYSRLLTPSAVVHLEDTLVKPEESFEVPARYPWLVHVRP